MKITVLIENTGTDPLCREHGLSFYIEHDSKKYLLDAGQSEGVLQNAKSLSIDLDSVDYTILSHGHYDHANGFLSIMEQYPEHKIYASSSVFEDYYSGSGGQIHYIGLDPNLKQKKNLFFCIDQDTKLEDNVYLILDEKMPNESAKLYRKIGDTYLVDDLSHELTLVFDTPRGLILFNSCSHLGLEPIVTSVKKKLKRPVYAYIGGLHLKSLRHPELVTGSMAKFIRDHISVVYTGHCTGHVAYQFLKAELKDQIHSLTTGKTFYL